MEVNNVITGKKGVSLPFTDYAEPITSSPEHTQAAFNHITDYGKKNGWKYLVTKGWDLPSNESIPSSFCYRHTLSLQNDEQKVFSQFRDSTKRNIKKAHSSNIIITTNFSLESLKYYYHLHCLTRKEHGLPPQPFSFFKNIFTHIISKKLGSVVLASYNTKYIAGAVFFHTKPYAIYKYGASDKKFQHLRANNQLMWEAIKNFCIDGYTQLCFGITEPDNKGLMQYKTGWDTKITHISRIKYDIRNKRFFGFNSQVKGHYNFFFKAMPLPLLKLAGSILYKNME